MNWYLSSHPITDISGAIKDYREMAAEVIDQWIKEVKPTNQRIEGFLMEEYPPSVYGRFYWKGVSYRFRGISIWGGYKLGKVPYDITIERNDPDIYADDMGPDFVLPAFAALRRRLIDVVPPIT
jgi:hypothetical protein